MSLNLTMRLESIKIPFLVKKLEEDEETVLLKQEITEIKKLLFMARQNFECAFEKENVDFYTYLIKAYEVKYNYLIKKARDKGIIISYV